MTLGQALHDRVFCLITAAALLGKGFSQTFAAEMTSVFLLVGIAGSLLGGYLADRFHTAKVGVPFSLIQALGAFLLMIVTARYGGEAVLVLAMALGGFSFAAYRPTGQYFQTQFFGLGSFTEIMSFQYMLTNPISAFSAPLIGAIYGRTHSYHLAFLLMALSPLIGGFVWLVLPNYRYAANIGETTIPAREHRARRVPEQLEEGNTKRAAGRSAGEAARETQSKHLTSKRHAVDRPH